MDDGHREAVALPLQSESLRPWNILTEARLHSRNIFSVCSRNPRDEFAHCRGCCGFCVCSVLNSYLLDGRAREDPGRARICNARAVRARWDFIWSPCTVAWLQPGGTAAAGRCSSRRDVCSSLFCYFTLL